MALLTGRELKQIVDYYSPFDDKGNLKPESERATILAANGNSPMEIFARAFAQAGSLGSGSPIIVQLSYNCINMMGSDDKAVKPIEGAQRETCCSNPTIDGAVLASTIIDSIADHYHAPFMSISLDHFKVPKFDPNAKVTADLNSVEARVAEARVRHALDFAKPVFGGEAGLDEKMLTAYINYLLSAPYRGFKQDFLGVIAAIEPAWGMIDTEHLPPMLDFVVTRDITDAARFEINNQDVIIEAEFGATGQTGQAIDYVAIRGKELEEFAHKVSCFLDYTKAEGIAYPIGMEHAAKRGAAHEPDVERLKVVGSTVIKDTGRYVPFVQHGGTGAASVARGLVGKNNVNTKFLVDAANSLADHVQKNLDGIRAGDKDPCGTKIYLLTTNTIAQATVDKLKEAGTFDTGDSLFKALEG